MGSVRGQLRSACSGEIGLRSRKSPWRSALFAAVAVVACAQEATAQQAAPGPKPDASSDITPEFYARWSLLSDPNAIVPADGLTLAGRKVSCLGRLTVLNPYLADYGAAFPRFIVVNPRKFERIAPAVQYWLYEHECGHEAIGPDETRADCFGIKKGVHDGWLSKNGLDQICAFINVGQPDATHTPGPERCRAMRACYAEATQNKNSRR